MLAHIGTVTPSRITSDCIINRDSCISAKSANTTVDRYATGLMVDSLWRREMGHLPGTLKTRVRNPGPVRFRMFPSIGII